MGFRVKDFVTMVIDTPGKVNSIRYQDSPGHDTSGNTHHGVLQVVFEG